MIPLILPSTSLTIFSYHLQDIHQRCLRNAPLKILVRLEECPSQGQYLISLPNTIPFITMNHLHAFMSIQQHEWD
ncbi:hypothetical protein GQ457_02G017110 [Hibiscus cannabinus]